MSDTRRNIAVLVGSSLAWREQIMRGIASFANENGAWNVFTAPEGEEYSVFSAAGQRWDGLIFRPAGGALVRRVLKLGIPVVSVGSLTVDQRIPRVKLNDHENTAILLRHLLAGGVRRFAYCSFYPNLKVEDRGQAFIENVRQAGYSCECFNQAYTVKPGHTWSQRQRQLTAWLKALPKPVGILCYTPDVACQVVAACNRIGVRVPDEVSIVASDDDPMKCQLTRPTITAAEVPAERIGYEAAALLERLIRGEQPPSKPVLISPSGVIAVRESTSISGSADREVQQAAELIRKAAAEGLSVTELAEQMKVSPRWLQRHFKRVLGATPRQVVQDARLERAKYLLLETDWPACRVAVHAGFYSASHLNRIMRQHTGMTPVQFRRHHRI